MICEYVTKCKYTVYESTMYHENVCLKQPENCVVYKMRKEGKDITNLLEEKDGESL